MVPEAILEKLEPMEQGLAGICLYWVEIVHGESVPID